MRRIAGLAAVALALLLLVLGIRTAALGSRRPAVAAAPVVVIDEAAAARRLAGGLRLRTVSTEDRAAALGAQFEAFRAYLERSYPRLHAALSRELVDGASLLYTWKGRQPELPALLLLAHQDVVPVEAGTEASWAHPPFEGVIDAGYVWGRGAADDKGNLFAILEAVEGLLAEGFTPERTLLLGFGHDEEVGGEGAQAIAARLASRGDAIESVLDEGGAIVQGAVPGVATPLAMIGTAEKGSLTIDLSVEIEGGHSSTPPRHTAIGILAAALTRLEANPMPGRIAGPTRGMADRLAPELGLPFRVVLANLWLFGPVLELAMAGQPPLDALLRTTTAVTIASGGVKENVLPARASAVVNFRILPGDTVEDVVAHVRRVVGDERIQIQPGVRSTPRNPTPESPVDDPSFARLALTVGEIFPGVPAVPFLVLGGTDARHYAELTPRLYRLSPFLFEMGDLKRVHGTDERLSIASLADGVRFFRRLIENSAPAQPPSP
ncbi:MAG TPA: M20 family peptidase [Myxococcota bacterium]